MRELAQIIPRPQPLGAEKNAVLVTDNTEIILRYFFSELE
jgi:hypothetical protein